MDSQKQRVIESYMCLGLPVTNVKIHDLVRSFDGRKIISRMRKKGFVILHDDMEGLDANHNIVKYREWYLDQNHKQPVKTHYLFHPSGRKLVKA